MRRNLGGIFALLVVGGFYLYRNRERIMDYLENMGVQLPEGFRDFDLKSRVQEIRSNVQERIQKGQERKAG